MIYTFLRIEKNDEDGSAKLIFNRKAPYTVPFIGDGLELEIDARKFMVSAYPDLKDIPQIEITKATVAVISAGNYAPDRHFVNVPKLER